ncbi:MAG: hypothetical protein GWN87_11830, partial [Desulfuromonadales bacterium]|nr:hypothetical protein [Desulfuromonadales bacterium]NIS41110.1 hypothetical protein [Desulfuromonadales bacterium]
MSLQPEGRIKIAPSLVAAPLHAVGELISHLEEGGADFLHIDIEDGRFVPGVLNLGIRLIEEIRPLTELPLDV